MNIQTAISIIESCAGFDDESTPAGEAWAVVRTALAQPAPEPLKDEEISDLARECVKAGKPVEWAIRTALVRWGQHYDDTTDLWCIGCDSDSGIIRLK
jgi:folate-dependent tRNA-U54 methylase TrmFO/GidA